MSKLCSLTTQTPSPRAAAPPGKRSTVKLCTQAPKAPCDLRATSSMWASPDLPFDPKIAFTTPHPLLVAECRCWRPLRFSHVMTVRQANTSERRGWEEPAVHKWASCFNHSRSLAHHLHCYNNGLRTRKAPSHNDGRVTPHYIIGLTATAEEHPNTVMSAPLRHPSVAGTEHIDTLSACGLRHRRSPAMELSRHVDVSVLPSTHSRPKSSCNHITLVTVPPPPPPHTHTHTHTVTKSSGAGGLQRRHLCNASLQCVSSSVF